MQFLKKHYEKIILCVVLLGLGAAVVWMGSAMRQTEEGGDAAVVSTRVKPLPPLDLKPEMEALVQITNPPPVVLSGDHNLFNPVTWRKKSNGELLKFLKTGPDALTIVNIDPLYLVITYDHPSSGGVYVLSSQEHSGRKSTHYAKKDEKRRNMPFIIRKINGSQDNPTNLVLEIPSTHEMATVTLDKPYKSVDGYLVDMRYAPESRNLSKLRLDESFTLDNEPYKIVEITNDLVRVQAINNTKVTTVHWNPNPQGGN